MPEVDNALIYEVLVEVQQDLAATHRDLKRELGDVKLQLARLHGQYGNMLIVLQSLVGHGGPDERT